MTCVLSNAQQVTHFTQYMYNKQVLNPAMTGSESFLEAMLTHRQQWTGFEGAPSVQMLSVHSAIKDKGFGIGGYLLNDRYGPFKEYTANTSFAYHISLNENTRLGLGFSLECAQILFSAKDIVLAEPDPNLITAIGYRSPVELNAGSGIYLHSKNYFIGVAALDLLQSDSPVIKEIKGFEQRKTRDHLNMTFGRLFYVNELVSMKLGGHFRYISGLPIQYNLNARVYHGEQAELGIMSTIGESYGLFSKLKVLPHIWVMYSYEHSTMLGLRQSPSHELSVKYQFVFDKWKKMKPLYDLSLVKFKREKKRKPRYAPRDGGAQPRF